MFSVSPLYSKLRLLDTWMSDYYLDNTLEEEEHLSAAKHRNKDKPISKIQV